MHLVNQLYLLFVQLPSVISCIDSISKKFPSQEKVDHRNSNPQSSDSKSDALSLGPCGPVSCQLYLLLVQLPSVVPYIDILCKNFPLCKTKCRPQRDSNPHSSDSKSDALSVPYIDILSEKFPLCKTKCRPQRDSNPHSSDSKSDALSVGPCGHATCQSIVCSLFSCQVLSLV